MNSQIQYDTDFESNQSQICCYVFIETVYIRIIHILSDKDCLLES